jgi:MFS family permease
VRLSRSPIEQLQKRIRPRSSTLERNVWNLYLEIGFFGFMFGILQTYLNVYAIRLGANNNVLGLLNAAQPLVFALGAIPAARLVERTQRRLRLIVTSSIVYRCGVGALGLMPFLLSDHRADAVVAIVLLTSIPQVFSNIGFSAMFADVVPSDLRARVVSVRNTVLGLTSTVATFLAGQYLGLSLPGLAEPMRTMFEFPLNYQVLFLVGFAVSMVGVIFLSRVHEEDQHIVVQPSGKADRRPLPARLAGFARLMLSQRDFTRYTIASFVIYWGLYLPTPLYSLFWVRSLHASDSYIGLILTVQSITSMVVYPLLPRLNARLGTRGLVGLSTLLISLYPLATAFVTTLEPLLVISVLGGVGNATFGLGTFNLLLEVTPRERRPSFLATFNLLTFTAGCIAPFIATALLDFIDIRVDLLLSFAVRFAGCLTFLVMVSTSSKARPSTV